MLRNLFYQISSSQIQLNKRAYLLKTRKLTGFYYYYYYYCYFFHFQTGVCTHRFTFDGRVMCLHAAFDLLFVGLNTGIVASIDLLVSVATR